VSHSSSPSILTASSVMAAGTVVSRLTGFVRATLLAAAIGITLHADVFNVANTIPNSLYILVAGGVFNSVLVPQLVRAIKNDPDGGDAYANRIITLSALLLAGVTAVLVVLAPWVLQLLADDSFFTDPALEDERDSLIAFARWCMPQIFFYGIFVLFGQVLNARGRFGPMMWAPILNNLIFIAVIVVYLVAYSGEPAVGGYSFQQELLLGLGSTLGIVAQAAILVPYLRASGFAIRPRTDFRGTGLGHTARLALWTIGFVIVNQIAFYVMVHRATSGTTAQAVEGVEAASGFTVYANAFLLTQVPHAVVTVSVTTAVMPLLSRLADDDRRRDVAQELTGTLRLVLAVIVPFALALLVLGPALATVMFSWGNAAGETGPLGSTLMAFAPGLVMFTVHYTVLRGFYALEDTRTPFFIQCVVAAVNITLTIGLTLRVEPVDVAPALALAYGGAYLVGGLLSLGVLSRRLGGLAGRALAAYVARAMLAAVPAALLAWLVIEGLGRVGLDETDKADSLVLLGAGGVVGVVAYVLAARLAGVTEVTRISAIVVSRIRRR
jgi:putative peptidoglycan lipid II flippase